MSDRKQEIAEFVKTNHWKMDTGIGQIAECIRLIELWCDTHRPKPPTQEQRHRLAEEIDRVARSPGELLPQYAVADAVISRYGPPPASEVEALRKERDEYQRGYEEQARQLAHKNAKLAEITKERDELAERNANQATDLMGINDIVRPIVGHTPGTVDAVRDIAESMRNAALANDRQLDELKHYKTDAEYYRKRFEELKARPSLRPLPERLTDEEMLGVIRAPFESIGEEKDGMITARQRKEVIAVHNLYRKWFGLPFPQITDAAVEACASSEYESLGPCAWKDSGQKEQWMKTARAGLAAALPHLFPVPARNLDEPGVEVRL